MGAGGIKGRKGVQRTSKPSDSQRRPPCQHPPQPLHLALTIAVQRDRDLVIQLLDLAFQLLLLHAHGHPAVVEQPAQVVFERQAFGRRALREDVDFVLQVRALGGHFLRGGFARVEDFGAQFRAGGAEEVVLL